MALLETCIKKKALELGFDTVGIAPAEPGEHLPSYWDWLAAGYHGAQSYLARPDRLARRQDLQVILPGVQSLVVVGLHYWPGPPPAKAQQPDRGRISCYAQGHDYHQIMLPMLENLLQFIQSKAVPAVHGRAYVDTGPLLERDHALRAGLGFIGKNCHLVQPRKGSWLFLGLLMLSLPLEPDQPGQLPSCGTCTRCQQACPTGALVRPFVLDSRRCLSYFTTALKESIPREFRPLLGNHIFGCDICQQVCPWNRFARPTVALTAANDKPSSAAPRLLELITLSENEFQIQFGHTPLGRIQRPRFLRNVAVAIGNWGDPEAAPALAQALQDPNSLVREHVVWALGQIGGRQARTVLEKARKQEAEAAVIEELELALDSH